MSNENELAKLFIYIYTAKQPQKLCNEILIPVME